MIAHQRTKRRLLTSAVVAVLVASPYAMAQQRGAEPAGATESTQGTGSISGSVYNPATGDYMRNAQVRINTIAGARLVTSGDRGEFVLNNVPAGTLEVVVSFTGYGEERRSVQLAPGQNKRVDFELRSTGTGVSVNETDLDRVVVSGAREGDARALMEQRASMNITNSLSTESYGEITEGNPGEFIKYMPGVNTDQVSDGTVRTVALRGMDPAYTSITLNGVSLAGADANEGASGSRTFSFEQLSIGGLDSIEISKTISADVDANAPAGTINLRTKRAFDRKGRQATVQISGTTHSDLWDSKERTGPDEGGYGSKRFLPGGQINFSDVFLDKRLGVVLGLGQSYTYVEQEQITASRNYVPNARQPSPLAITSIKVGSGQREIYRGYFNSTIDFKATDNLILSLTTLYNESGIWAATGAAYTFTTSARANNANVALGDGMLDITTNVPATTNMLSLTNAHTYKKGTGRNYIPSFEYNNEHFKLDGNLFYSDSVSKYNPLGEKGVAQTTGAITAKGNFTATRSDIYKQDWQITQISGPDWADASSFSSTNPFIIRLNNGTWSDVVNKGGAMNLTFDEDFGKVPVVFKTGFKVSESHFMYGNHSDRYRYGYYGPMTTTELLESIRSDNQISAKGSGVTITTISGSHDIYLPSMEKLAALYHSDPSVWQYVPATSASEWYNIHVGEDRDYKEKMSALYFMGTAEFTEKLKARAGVRWEKTDTDAHEYDARSAQDVAAAGYPINATTGLPTTVEGMEYMYASQPKVHRKGSYSDFFPSASLKYSFTDSLDLQVGYSRTIRRPEVDQLSGVWSISDTLADGAPTGEGVITAPNPGLEPEYSDNLSVRVVKYFEPVGLLAINYYRNKIKGLFQTVELTADEFGYTGQDYANYIFRTTQQVSGEAVDIQGWELEFNHAMDYLLKDLAVRGSFMYNDPEIPIVRQADKAGSLSISYARGPLKLNLNNTWTDFVYRTTTPSWFTPFWNTTLSGSYTFVRQSKSNFMGVEAFFSVNNLVDKARNVVVPNTLATGGGLGAGNHSAIYQQYGRNATIGIRARF